jgi:predicted dehydrogenase
MDAGMDVYCQKPVTLTVEEALDVRDKVRATGRVFQCGAQFTSADMWWQARDFIKKGGIGEVVYAQADYSRNSGSPENPIGGEWNYTIDPEAGPNASAGEGYIDWDQWIGPSKNRPYSAPRFFQFRKFWDYSGGVATDLLYHVIAPLVLALDLSAPEKVSSGGGIFVQHDDREVPDTFFITADFPEDCSVLLTSSMANRQQNPLMIRGHRATIRPEAASGGKLFVTPEKEFAEWFKKEYGSDELVIEEKPRADHMTNFFDAMRNRTTCHCSADTAYKAMAVTKLGCDAYRADKTLFWDNGAEKQVRKHPRPGRSSKVPAVRS